MRGSGWYFNQSMLTRTFSGTLEGTGDMTHMTTLMLDLKDQEIGGLMTLCQMEHRQSLAGLCESEEEVLALMGALDEITWRLARCGHEDAIQAWSETVVD